MNILHAPAEPSAVDERIDPFANPGPPAATYPWQLYGRRQRWFFLAILFLVATANYFDYFILSVLLEPIKNEFQVSDTMLGLLSGLCFALVYSLAALPTARWADRGNRRTVITVALVAWSCMTLLCGLAQSFWQLALARFGVGAAEPGALPSAQSLISDYFPPDRRAIGFAVVANGGSAAGWILGIGLGSYLGATYGWRVAFLVAGTLSLVLAVVVRIALAEPRTLPRFSMAGTSQESLRQTLSILRRKRSFVRILAGAAIYAVFLYGVMVFIPSFLIRSLHASMVDVSTTWAVVMASANLLGAVAGGWLSDRLGARDIRWYAWIPAISCAVGGPLYALAFHASDLWVFIGIEFLAELVLSMGIPIVFAVALAVCGSRRRVTASAAVFCAMGLIGGNLGPLLVGALSDAFAPAYGADSLRYALLTVVLCLAPATVVFWWASCPLQSELEA
jgi:predicted MFS family arabinose efflux permease